jgi:hypothetical protein
MTFFRKREITIERGKPQENKNNGWGQKSTKGTTQ